MIDDLCLRSCVMHLCRIECFVVFNEEIIFYFLEFFGFFQMHVNGSTVTSRMNEPFSCKNKYINIHCWRVYDIEHIVFT